MPITQQVQPISMTGVLAYNASLAGQPGWLRVDGRTIGNAGSGATSRANGDTKALYRHLWAEYTNAELVIQTSAGAGTVRGASADADFAAGKRLPLPNPGADFIRALDPTGATDVGRLRGTHQAGQMPSHTHNTTFRSVSNSSGGGGVDDADGGPQDYPSSATGGTDNASENRPPNTAYPLFIHL